MILLALLGYTILSPPPIGAADLWPVVEELAFRDFLDARFLYEGRYWKAEGNGECSGSNFRFTYQGEFVFHRDGVARCDVYLPQEDARELRSLRRGGEHRSIDTRPGYKRQEKKPMAPRFAWTGMLTVHSAARHWWLPVVQQLPMEARSAVKELRTERIDGHDVHVVLLDLLPSETGQRTWNMRVRLDLDRGGNAIRWEWLRGGRLQEQSRVLEWKEFADKSGKRFWLPVRSVWESFVADDGKYQTTPTYRETFYLLQETLALNTGLRADSLEVTFDPKTKLHDSTVPQPAPVPAELRPTGPRLTPAMIEKTLRQAKEQEAELLVRANQRTTRVDWTGWIAMALAVLGLGILAAAWYLHRARSA